MITIVTDECDATAIYIDDEYIGKEDQVDPWELFVKYGGARKIVVPEEKCEDFYNWWGLPLSYLAESFGIK